MGKLFEIPLSEWPLATGVFNKQGICIYCNKKFINLFFDNSYSEKNVSLVSVGKDFFEDEGL